ncbi:hypothetical protein FKG94_27920 [Exilibacterium tricleocarpae]|uniref:Uncharacterized protein n=1 Tax=Exilibacterium tricleocarpae TaxID=2591008 RepID=A0A545SLW8_9GAMM|nr:hypothetical protein [Exilibacterium tricleocarpae]TQV65836.1 hypothetical protein FKG94_27920 [Exilibacterium tricleocarpae]
MKEFEILENQARDLYKAFPELEFRTIAAFTLIIGWLLTAEHAQSFILNNAFISKLSASFAFGSFAIVQAIFLRGHYLNLSRVCSALEAVAKENGYSLVIVNTYRVSSFLPISYALINVLFCLAIVTLVVVIGSA